MTRRSPTSQRVWYRAPLVAPCLLVLTSCHEVIPSIFVNDSSAEGVVRYTMLRWEIAPGVLPKCRFDSDPERYVETVVSARNWKIVAAAGGQ